MGWWVPHTLKLSESDSSVGSVHSTIVTSASHSDGVYGITRFLNKREVKNDAEDIVSD